VRYYRGVYWEAIIAKTDGGWIAGAHWGLSTMALANGAGLSKKSSYLQSCNS